MSARAQVLDRLRLLTHPFDPERGPDGQPIPRRLMAKTLDPRKDPRLLHYYFDVYDWSGSPFLGGLSRELALRNFPQPEELRYEGPLLILVSGTGLTGRNSLINLILHKIKVARQDELILIDAPLSSIDKAQSVREMAKAFISDYQEAKPTTAQLQEVYDQETKDKPVPGEGYYTSLFKRLGSMVRKHTERPIVFQITGGEHYDVWTCLYNSSVRLADYLLVETSRPADAQTCSSRLAAAGKNVAHIDACLLDRGVADRYLRDRLAAERPTSDAPTDPLLPFTHDALDRWYESGSDAAASSSVKWSVGWLRNGFRRVLHEHLEELTALATQDPQAFANLPLDRLLIDGDKMWNVRQRMNNGG